MNAVRRVAIVSRTGSLANTEQLSRAPRDTHPVARRCQNWQLWKLAATWTAPTPYARHRSRPHKGRELQQRRLS